MCAARLSVAPARPDEAVIWRAWPIVPADFVCPLSILDALERSLSIRHNVEDTPQKEAIFEGDGSVKTVTNLRLVKRAMGCAGTQTRRVENVVGCPRRR